MNPNGHVKHDRASADEYCPAGHATGDTFLVAQNEPAGQSVHTVARTSENWPVLHTFGPATVVDAQNDPAGQSVHTVANGAEYWPIKQATGTTVLVAQNDPAGQSVQTVALARAY